MPAPETCVIAEIIGWILQEFKGQHAGDYMEVTQHLSEKDGFFITEAKISFRTSVYKKGLDQDDMQRMRNELDRLTGDSIQRLEFMESTAARYTSQSILPQNGGTALLMRVEVLHKEKI